MSISVNGQSCVPPGFRFHPTEEELLNYYLRKKVASEKIDLDVIKDVDLNKLEPWDIQEKCRIGGSTPQSDWYFFSHKDKKYPTGTRTNRATAAGFWKATGRDKVIYTSSRRIGMRKTLVFYKGRAPHGQKSDWIMHEYRLDDHSDLNPQSNNTSFMGAEMMSQEDGWVVCRVFKKKNHHKAIGSPNNCSSITTDHGKNQLLHSASDDALDQILQYMGRSCKQESDVSMNNHRSFGISSTPSVRYLRPIDTVLGAGVQERFMKLPALESPTYPQPPPARSYAAIPLDHSYVNQTNYMAETVHSVTNFGGYTSESAGTTDWATFDRLLASQLNGQADPSSIDDDSSFNFCSASKLLNTADYEEGGSVDDGDLWSLTRSASSASDHISHASL